MSQVLFAVYNSSGQILRQGSCKPDDVIHQAVDGTEWAMALDAAVDPEAVYVLNSALTARLPNAISASASGRVITVTGIPIGLRVYVTGQAFAAPVADDPSGAIAITVPGAGRYVVNVDPFPLLPFREAFDIV